MAASSAAKLVELFKLRKAYGWISCWLANWWQPLIGQMMSAADCPTEISCSLANWNQLLIGWLTSASHWPTDVSCWLSNWNQLLIVHVQLKSSIFSSIDIYRNHVCFDRIYWSFWSCFSKRDLIWGSIPKVIVLTRGISPYTLKGLIPKVNKLSYFRVKLKRIKFGL